MILNTTSNISSRNNGIDFLRILSMYMVVILHTLGQGGILSNLTPGSTPYKAAWLLETAAYCAVNCYALISGYVGCHSKFKLSRLAILWLQTSFYTIGLTTFFSLTHPEFITAQVWVNACFPIMNIQYWYLTTYFGMYIFIPIMNLALQQLNKKYLQCLIIIFFVFFITIPTFMQQDTFSLSGGFSVIWLCMLYIIGGYIKIHQFMLPRKVCLIVYMLSVFATWFFKMRDIPFLLDYTSPTIFLAALSLLLIFANTNFKNALLQKCIQTLAPTALSVYIIHVNPLIWNSKTHRKEKPPESVWQLSMWFPPVI